MADDTLQSDNDLIATDELSTLNGTDVSGASPRIMAQRAKLGFGSDGVFRDVDDSFPLPVDNAELPAAAALGDAMANPTTTTIGAMTMGWSGSDWRRIHRVAAADGSSASLSSLVTWSQAASFNGTTWDRQRGNVDGSALASAARTASPSISNVTTYNACGILLFLNITATPNNAETLTVALEAVDSVSSAVKPLTAFPAITASTLGASPAAGVREFVYHIYPGAVETVGVNNIEVQGVPISRVVHPKITHSSTGSWTYSLGYSLLV